MASALLSLERMNILEQLVGPEGLPPFIKYHLGHFPFAKPGAANEFEDVISWNLLNEIFESHDDCWLPKNGQLPKTFELSQGQLTLEQAQNGFREGRTVLVRHAEHAHAVMADIARSFRDLFKSPIDIQLYITPKDTEGFDWHYDLEDVFVIQTTGEKEFRLLPNTVTQRPLPMMTKENVRFVFEKKSPEIRCWLKAGDWLYIPAGYWHKARAITDSFHLSVGVLI